jgi:hypothetical protein
MYHFIYETTNLINGKKYRGKHSTDDLGDGYMGSGIAIMRAIRKYGKCNFTREIIAWFDSDEEAYANEEEWINEEWVKRSDTYNMMIGGTGFPSGESHPLYGIPLSAERRRQISEATSGRLHTEEAKRRMSEVQSGEKHWNYGGTISDDHKRALSEFNLKHSPKRGKPLSDSTKAKISEAQSGEKHWNYGGTHTEEHRQKISKAQSGEKHWNFGGTISDEHKETMRQTHLGKPKKIVTCPHCNKSGGEGAMKRWHFDNCKSK